MKPNTILSIARLVTPYLSVNLVAFLPALLMLGASPALAHHCGSLESQVDGFWKGRYPSPAANQEYRRLEEALVDCRGEHYRSGGGSSGGGGGGGNRFQQGLGALQGLLGSLRDINRQREERQREENHRLGGEANDEGIEHLRQGRYEQALDAFQRAYQYFQRNGDTGNMNVAEHNAGLAREATERERQARQWKEEQRRWEEQHKAKQAERDQMISDLFSPNLTGGGARNNPFQQPSAVPSATTSALGAGPVASLPRAPNPFEPQSQASLRPTLPSEEPLNRQMLTRPECRQSDDAYWAERAIAGGFNTAEELIVGQQDYDRRRKLGCFAAESQRLEAPAPSQSAEGSVPGRQNPFNQ